MARKNKDDSAIARRLRDNATTGLASGKSFEGEKSLWQGRIKTTVLSHGVCVMTLPQDFYPRREGRNVSISTIRRRRNIIRL